MFRRLMVLGICITIGFIFTNTAFTQDDPATTDAEKKAADEKKNDTGVKDETVKKDDSGQKTVISTTAKSFSDGFTTFVNAKVQFKLTAEDNVAVDKIEYKIDDSAVTVYGQPFSIDKEGTHVIKYYGIDKTGNKEAEKAFSLIVDTTAPVVIVTTTTPIRKIGDKMYYNKDLAFCINTSDALSGVDRVEYSLDGTTFQPYTAPFKIGPKGDINLKVKATDNVGNVTDIFVFRVIDDSGKEVEIKDGFVKLSTDNTSPVVEIKPDKEVKQYNGQNLASTDIKYSILAKDEESGVAVIMYRVDGKGDFIPYKDPVQFLTNGKHQIEAKAIDKAGNESTVLIFMVYVDTIPPDSKIETVK